MCTGRAGTLTTCVKIRSSGTSLTVMDGGEHWFLTAEQMAFLDKWIRTEAL